MCKRRVAVSTLCAQTSGHFAIRILFRLSSLIAPATRYSMLFIYNFSLMFYRSDNRSPDQLRPVVITPDFIRTAEGSALIEVGNTRVICTASGEDAAPQLHRDTDRA